MNPEAYFRRIGFVKKAKADLETLKELHLLHTQTFPFENLNPLLKIPVLLDIQSLYEKMILHARGGYCFEQNILFGEVLRTIGFQVRNLAGRVLIGREENEITAKSHMLLLITLDEIQYIADVGFGGNTLPGPLELKNPHPQETIFDTYRISQRSMSYFLHILNKGEWKTLYKFDKEERYPVDYKVFNWYTSTHPDSHFTHSLSVALKGKDCRFTLSNNIFKIHHLKGKVEERILDNIEEVVEILKSVFKIDLPSVHNSKEVLEKLIFKS